MELGRSLLTFFIFSLGNYILSLFVQVDTLYFDLGIEIRKLGILFNFADNLRVVRYLGGSYRIIITLSSTLGHPIGLSMRNPSATG